MALSLVNTATVFDVSNAALAIDGAWGVTAAYAGGNAYIYVGGNVESGISAFAVNAAGQLASVSGLGGNIRDADNANLAILGTAGLASISFETGSVVYAVGSVEAGLSSFSVLGANGALLNHAGTAGSVRDLELPQSYKLGGALDVAAVTVGGNAFAIVAGYGDNGLSLFRLNSVTGGIDRPAVNNVADGDFGITALAGVRSVATAVIGATTYLFAAAQNDNALSFFSVSATGVLGTPGAVLDNATLNLGGASAVTTAVVAGRTYVLTAGTVDDGLSVFFMPPGGSPSNVFNINDTAALYLRDVHDLVTVKIAGTSYLFAASLVEHGISAFAIAADGSLVNMANVVDTASLGISGAAQLATVVVGGRTFLAATGYNDDAVSLFRVDATGVSISGTAAADIIDATHAPARQLLPSELGDTIRALGGNDVVRSLGGNDVVDGGAGNDSLNGGLGADTLRGGTGNDLFYVDNSGDKIIEAAGQGTDVAYTSVNYTLAAGQHVESLAASSPAGTASLALSGNSLAQRITGNNGGNTINGAGGNDILIGLGGNDVLVGGLGVDTLAGGAGNDSFLFNAPLSTANRDIITDFANAAGNNDTIRLENAVMTKLGAGVHVLNPAFFRAGAAALDANDFIVYNRATGALFYDVNAHVAGGAVQIATLTNRPVLTASDFFVV